MSMNPNDFVNEKSVAPMNDNKHPAKQELDMLTVHNMDDKEQGSPLVAFLKKHQTFLILQCVLLILLGVSFLFW
ncbi:hypothetical protein [Moraxella lacunata]|nr:hypothetical protein [Moraxella lacunata]